MLTTEERTDLVALLKESGNTQAALVADRLEAEADPSDELVAEAYAALELERDILLAKKATLERVRDQVVEVAATHAAVTGMVEQEAEAIIDGTDEDAMSDEPVAPAPTNPVEVATPVVPAPPAPTTSPLPDSTPIPDEQGGSFPATPANPPSAPAPQPTVETTPAAPTAAPSSAPVAPDGPPAMPPSAFPDPTSSN